MTTRRILTIAALGLATAASLTGPAEAGHCRGRTYVYNGHTGYYTGGNCGVATAYAPAAGGCARSYAAPYAAPAGYYAPQASPAYAAPQASPTYAVPQAAPSAPAYTAPAPADVAPPPPSPTST